MSHMPGCFPVLHTAYPPGTRPLTSCLVKEVGQEAAHDSLVRDNEDVALTL